MRFAKAQRLGGYSKKRAFVMYIIIGVLTVLAILGFSLFSMMQDENLRVHRVFYSTAAIKVAEAVEAEAFNWLAVQLRLPRADQHPYIKRLYTEKTIDLAVPTGSEPSAPDGRYLDLLSNDIVPFAVDLATEMTGRAVIKEAHLVYRDFQPIFESSSGGLDYESQGAIEADPLERTGMIELSVLVAYGRVKRGLIGRKDLTKRYVSRREIKVVNVLPPVVGRFTLFSRGFRCNISLTTPMHDKEPYNIAYGRADLAGSDGVGVTDFSKNQPLILINHPEDVKERVGFCKHYREIVRYSPWEPPFDNTEIASSTLSAVADYRPDLQRRGWVFLGGDKPWKVNLQSGQGNSAAGAELPAGYDFSFCQQSTLEGFQYHESYRTAKQSEIVGLPGGSGWDPIKDVSGGTVPDYRFALYHYGFIANMIEQALVRKGLLGNNYDDPVHSDESLRPSVLRLFGDIQPLEIDGSGKTTRYLDRRSPTVVFGPVLRRFIQGTVVFQDVPSLTFPYPPGSYRSGFLPYFKINRDGTYSGTDYTYPWSSTNWTEASIAPADLNVVDDTTTTIGVPVTFKLREEVFNFSSGDPYQVYLFLMSKVIAQSYNDGYDWIVENSNPSAGLDPRRHLKQENIKSLTTASGTVEDKNFFYNTVDASLGCCYFARNLAFKQYDDSVAAGGDSVDTLFTDGYFRGSLDALQLFDNAQITGNFDSDIPPTVDKYDIRLKTIFRYANEDEFKSIQFSANPASFGNEIAVSLIADGNLDLTDGSTVMERSYNRSGIVIVKGSITLPTLRKTPEAAARGETLTFISLSGDIMVSGPLVEASLIALAPGKTVKRSVAAMYIRGNVIVDKLDFSYTDPYNVFGPTMDYATMQPTGTDGLEGFCRNVIEYDPALDCGGAGNYARKYRAFMASGISYWKTSEE